MPSNLSDLCNFLKISKHTLLSENLIIDSSEYFQDIMNAHLKSWLMISIWIF